MCWMSCDCHVDTRATHITDDRQLCQSVQYGEPDPYVLSTLGNHSPGLTDKLLGVQSQLHPVVKQGEQRCQGKGGHEHGDKTKLQD